MSPTARSLAYLRDLGYVADVVERRIPRVNILKDLFGFADIVAIRANIVAVQTTSASNRAARRAKIQASPLARQWLLAGGEIQLHAWDAPRPPRRRTWKVTVETITLEQFEGEA